MVERIQKYNDVGEIIIVDNGSTYAPLLEWYLTKPCTIIMSDNLGHTAPWKLGLPEKLKCEYYIETDSDMGLDDTPDDTLVYMRSKIKELNIRKLGLGLNWWEATVDSPYYNHLNTYEKNRVVDSKVVSDVCIDVLIDTTFAMYLGEERQHSYGNGCTKLPYIAKHYPWYLSKAEYEQNEEFKYYIHNANSSSSYKSFLGLFS